VDGRWRSFRRSWSKRRAFWGDFMDALSCIDQCFIAGRILEQLPAPSQAGKTKVGGIDLNKPRMRWVVEAVIALSPSPNGFTASQLAGQVQALSQQDPSAYGARRAAYDLKKLRGKKIVQRIGRTRRYEPVPKGLRAMAALVVLRNQAIKPLLAAAQGLRAIQRRAEPTALDTHYDKIRTPMRGVFQELGLAALKHRQLCFRASLKRLNGSPLLSGGTMCARTPE